MIASIEVHKGICSKVVDKAIALIEQVESGLLRPKKIIANKARVIEIDRRHRAIKQASKDYWYVCTHEKYNKLVTNGRRCA